MNQDEIKQERDRIGQELTEMDQAIYDTEGLK